MSGKGDKRRSKTIPTEKFKSRWDTIFGSEDKPPVVIDEKEPWHIANASKLVKKQAQFDEELARKKRQP
jgi:hypothetical protein